MERSSNNRDNGWRPTARRGQIMIMFAAGLLLLVGIVAMAVDVGFLMAERRQVQNAADAGALAAAKAKLDYLYESDRETIEVNTGKQYGASNADTAEDNVDVDPDPEVDGFDDVYVDGVNRYVEVTVAKDVQSFFLRALYTGDWDVTASAVAGMEPVKRPYALLALGCGSGGNGGIHISGSGTINVHEGSIMSNCGITTSGAAGSSVVTADGAIDAHGKIEDGQYWSAGEGINEDLPPINDPIVEEGIEPPSKTEAQDVRTVIDEESMRQAVTNLEESQTNPYSCPSGVTCVMQPGYYGGEIAGLNVHGTLEMQPGIYYFDDNFVLEGQASGTLIEGSKVLLYFTGNAAFDPKNAEMILSSVGSEQEECEPNLDAMLLWIENGSPFEMQSSQADFKFDGVLYAPDSHVKLYGGPYSSGMQVIANSLDLAGGLTIDIPYEDCIPMERPQVFLVK